ncbi:MAG: ATP-binding protein, partial [Pseudobdellovibrionaceae bacterium]|nr:ATP-binding protein [Pseudobdellovibrionaceae bacterium]
HGVEPLEVRARQGKPESGRIRVEFLNEEMETVINVSDDGQGIDPGRVVDKARQLGLIDSQLANSLSEEKAMDLIFLSALSTRDHSTEYSGRGVGLDFVRSLIESVGGTVKVTSSFGIGTSFQIRLPHRLQRNQPHLSAVKTS